MITRVVYAEIGLFRKPMPKKLGRLAKTAMSTIGVILYISKEEIVSMVGSVLAILKMYVDENLLVERFVCSIQELIADIYYSGFLARMTTENIVSIINLCMQIGWRNAFQTYEHLVLPLPDYLKGKSLFGVRSLFGQTEDGPEFAQVERKLGITVSQLTFPGGESGRKMAEDVEAKQRIRGRNTDPAATHFGYQNDTYMVMHEATVNIIRFFLTLSKANQAEILPYIARIAALETKNEQSLILQQTLVLHELASWYCHSNLERMNDKEKSKEYSGKGKYWLLNDSVVRISVEGKRSNVCIRNIVGCAETRVELDQTLARAPVPAKDNLRALHALAEGVRPETLPTPERARELDPAINPEYLLSTLPFALYNRTNEKLAGWEPLDAGPDVQGLVESLDEVPAYCTHNVGVVYIPKDCDPLDLSAVYSVRTGSERFQRFLSELGTLVSIKDCAASYHLGGMPRNGADGLFGVVWRDEISQVFFHVNTLMQYIERNANKYRNLKGKIDPQEEEMASKLFNSLSEVETKEPKPTEPLSDTQVKDLIRLKIKRYLNADNVVIVWNETGRELDEAFFRRVKTSVFIVITPFLTNYCSVKIVNVLSLCGANWRNS